MIKTILFDLDGLAIVKPKFFSSHFAETHGLSLEKMEPFFKNEFQLCLTGKADLKIELEKKLPEWGAFVSAEEYMKLWFEYESTKYEPFLAMVQQFRGQGIRCYIQTRNEKYRTEYLWSVIGLKEYFDDIFASPDLGYAKPDLQFWAAIYDRLGSLNKSEILVWDDKEENAESAKAFGYRAELYKDFPSFQNRMVELLNY